MSLPIHSLEFVDGGLPFLSDRVRAGLFPNLPFPAGTAALTALGAVTAGTGFTSVNTVSVTPTGGTGTGATAQATSIKVVAAAVATGGAGTGYTTGDTLTLPNGVVLTATATAGAITALAITNAGSAQQAPSNPVAPLTTSGAGTGALINLTWGLGGVALTNSGSYTAAPTGWTVTDSGGGTGAAVAAPTLGGAGGTIYVGVSGLLLPLPYEIHATPSVPAFVSVPTKLSTGFTLGLTPIASTGTLAAGTVDVMLIG